MAFPVVADYTAAKKSTAATTHAFAYPSTMEVGDMVVIILALQSTVTNDPSPGAGEAYTRTVLQNGARTTGGYTHEIFYHRWTGDEGPNYDTAHGSAKATGIILRVTGMCSMSELLASVADSSSTSTPDGPSLNPPDWGNEEILWLNVLTWKGAATVTNGVPTNYTNITAVGGDEGDTGPPGLQISYRNLQADSEDPGNCTLSTSDAAGCWTVAIRSVAANYPIIKGNRQTYQLNSQNKTFYPPTNIIDGYRLIWFISYPHAGVGATGEQKSGWTVLYHAADSTNRVVSLIMTKIASSEPSSYSWDAGSDRAAQSDMYAFNGHDSATPPEHVLGTNTLTTPDPASITASWGSDENCFIQHMVDNSFARRTHPEFYGWANYHAWGAQKMRTGFRRITGATDNAGVWGGGASDWHICQSLVLRGGDPILPGGPPPPFLKLLIIPCCD